MSDSLCSQDDWCPELLDSFRMGTVTRKRKVWLEIFQSINQLPGTPVTNDVVNQALCKGVFTNSVGQGFDELPVVKYVKAPGKWQI